MYRYTQQRLITTTKINHKSIMINWKKANHKRMSAVWFHLHDIQEKAIAESRKVFARGQRVGDQDWLQRGPREHLGVMKMFYAVTATVIIWLHKFVKTHQIRDLMSMKKTCRDEMTKPQHGICVHEKRMCTKGLLRHWRSRGRVIQTFAKRLLSSSLFIPFSSTNPKCTGPRKKVVKSKG